MNSESKKVFHALVTETTFKKLEKLKARLKMSYPELIAHLVNYYEMSEQTKRKVDPNVQGSTS